MEFTEQLLSNHGTNVYARQSTRSVVNGGPLTHESGGVGDVGADLAIDLDESLHADLLHLIPSQRVLEAVP